MAKTNDSVQIFLGISQYGNTQLHNMDLDLHTSIFEPKEWINNRKVYDDTPFCIMNSAQDAKVQKAMKLFKKTDNT